MSQVNTTNPVELEQLPQALKQAATQQSDTKKKEENGSVDPLLIAYLEIFHSVQINHETAGIKSKELQTNAIDQNNLINQEAMVNFSTITRTQIDKVTKSKRSTYLETLNTHNQEISALRSNLGDKLTVLKQNAQVSETDVNTVMNSDQQDISQGSSLMQMLTSLTNQIVRI